MSIATASPPTVPIADYIRALRAAPPFSRPLTPSQYVAEYAPMLKQFGAVHVATPDKREIKLTFTSSGDAAMARAALDDSVAGATLVIDDSPAAVSEPLPTKAEVAAFIARIPNVDVRLATVAFVPTLMIGSSDSNILDGLRRVVREHMTLSDGTLRADFFAPEIVRRRA